MLLAGESPPEPPSPTSADLEEVRIYHLDALAQSIQDLTSTISALETKDVSVFDDDELESASEA